ncbi:hypothetical protein V8B55DRAFT_1473889 [Mucor lusitanicus]|uniref:ubiquitinyl hydrolase 1 n=2 Tax=Mucor circinelloides f. lusitanicus TaxID=29924 RepID=A0A8H4BGQ2_MUCCL|nr:hypothetical protein FB192DRAFT_1098281 [Mucor lusitanicus]
MGKRNNKNRHGNSGNFKNQNRNNVQKNRKHQDNNNNQKPAQHQQQPGKKVEKINTSIKAPLFDKSKLLSTWKINRKIGPGYVNGQNTCFLNSVLECLTYTPPLAQQMLREEHQKQCRMDGFCALCAMEVHVRRCLKDEKSFSKGAAILPRYFTSNLRALSKTLRLGRQEDAHEFYMFMLSAFQKASIQGLGKLPPKVEETALVYQIFGGKLRSQLKCYSCKATSNNYEACLDLSVDLTNKADSLERAFQNFIKVDVIGSDDPNNRYKCDHCKQMVKAGKQMTINELPMMLTVHLKRFAFDMYRGCMSKITTYVDYPETLDMAPYTSQDKKIEKAEYSLYAVLVHYGYSCDSGHYYAYVKAPNGQWNRMDDEDVTPVSLKEVLSQTAYMLFYQQSSVTTSADTAIPAAAAATPLSTQLPNQPLPLVVSEPIPKKVLVDITAKKPTVPERRVKFIDQSAAISDNPRAWTVNSTDRPRRSLRGNLSPETYSANVGDISAWNILTAEQLRKKQQEKKRRRFRVKLESKKKPWVVGNPY